MGFDKLMHPLAGKPVLQHSIDAFTSLAQVDAIVVVTSEERFKQLTPHPKLIRADGAAERHLSVSNGINALPAELDLIAVHDGARPLITQQQILKVCEQAQIHQAATSACKVTDTMKRSDANGFSSASVDRENLWAMETPQVFLAPLLLQAYQHVSKHKLLVTDEVSALEAIGVPTKLVHNTTENLKITFPEDIASAEFTLARFNR